jgi:hypothetical protein
MARDSRSHSGNVPKAAQDKAENAKGHDCGWHFHLAGKRRGTRQEIGRQANKNDQHIVRP